MIAWTTYTFVNKNFSFDQWYHCPTLKAKHVRAMKPVAAAVDLQTMGWDLLRNLSYTLLMLKSTTPTWAAKGRLLELNLQQQPTTKNGHSAWHGVRVTSLRRVFVGGARPGPADG